MQEYQIGRGYFIVGYFILIGIRDDLIRARKKGEVTVMVVADFLKASVFYPLPDFLISRLQRIQLAAASFVVGRYINNISDVMNIGWLLIP